MIISAIVAYPDYVPSLFEGYFAGFSHEKTLQSEDGLKTACY